MKECCQHEDGVTRRFSHRYNTDEFLHISVIVLIVLFDSFMIYCILDDLLFFHIFRF